MPDLSLSTISFQQPAQIQQVQKPAPPQPPKSQSDHTAANASTSSRGPAVVLSGAFSQGTDKKRDGSGQGSSGQGSSGQGSSGGSQAQPSTQGQATGQHINHVI
jgi:hypothetical protein